MHTFTESPDPSARSLMFEPSDQSKQHGTGDALEYLHAHRPTYRKQDLAPHAFLQFTLDDKPDSPRGRIVPVETRHETDVDVGRLQVSQYFVDEDRDAQPDLGVISRQPDN